MRKKINIKLINNYNIQTSRLLAKVALGVFLELPDEKELGI